MANETETLPAFSATAAPDDDVKFGLSQAHVNTSMPRVRVHVELTFSKALSSVCRPGRKKGKNRKNYNYEARWKTEEQDAEGGVAKIAD